jgi:APA family basic amino acid/polyamine antiporter
MTRELPAGGEISQRALPREVGVFGATMMGLGAVIGTGVFVSIGVAAGEAGPSVVLAVAVAAVVAICNALSSAELAASHPVSGGTYEYGYRYLMPSLGFSAGWMFLCAKTASAATAALGFAGYLLGALAQRGGELRIALALLAVTVLTVLVLGGIRRSNFVNVLIVGTSIFALLFFIVAGLPTAISAGGAGAGANFRPFFATDSRWPLPGAGFLEACALMFVAYTGYGRVATLGEEVRQPRFSIPRAILLTVLLSMALYVGVALVGVAAVGAEAFGRAGTVEAAPLEIVAGRFGVPGAGLVMAVGAVTAMLGVLLNLILGLSRVVLAMGRHGDLPAALGRLNAAGTTPSAAVVLVGAAIAGLVLIGNVKTTWSFSAFAVLIYYAITNLAALRLPPAERRYPRVVPCLGLAACLFLALWVERAVWMTGLGLLAGGIGWHFAARAVRRRATKEGEP